MEMQEYAERLARTEERAKSNTHRLDKLEPVVDEIHKMSNTLVVLTTEIQHTNQTVNRISDKVEQIEQEPAKRWKDSTKALFNALLGAIGTATATGLIWLITRGL